VTTLAEPTGGPGSLSRRSYGRRTAVQLTLRWALIAALAVLAFHESLLNLLETTAAGGIGGYVWTVPPAAAVAALGVDLRRHSEPAIHDRQTDIIFGCMGLGLCLMVQAVLVPRYGVYFYLLRLDLLALWLFLLSSCIILFGIRPVIRFRWVWLVLASVFALPYQVIVITLGGGKFAAGLATLPIGMIATAVAVGRTRRHALIGAGAAFGAGLVVLVLIRISASSAPLFVYQQVPTLFAVVSVSGAAYLYLWRSQPKRPQIREVEALSTSRIWAGIPIVAAAAVALALIGLPGQLSSTDISRSAPYPLIPGRALVAPPGWSISAPPEFTDVQRYYGDGAVLVRQHMTADIGDLRFDKHGLPRTLVVDSYVSDQPLAFAAYPGRVLYESTGVRMSAPRRVDLGNGVRGQIFSVVDDRLLITWDVLVFTWGDDDVAQTVAVFAVDNHEADAPFPEPTKTLASTMRSMFTVLFRGNTVTIQRRPDFKDAELLTEFGQALVAAQFPPAG
jgi:hypothetical protein